MIKVNIINNLSRSSKLVDENTTTLRAVLDEAGVNYGRFQTQLDGNFIAAIDLDTTFAEHGVTDQCFLSSVVKADSASK